MSWGEIKKFGVNWVRSGWGFVDLRSCFMKCYRRPLSSTSFSVKLLQHEGAPQIVANKQELDGVHQYRVIATRRAFRIEHCVTDA